MVLSGVKSNSNASNPSDEIKLLSQALPSLPKIDSLVSALKNYIYAESGDYFNKKIPDNLKIDFLRERRDDFIVRVDDLLEELKLFSSKLIYIEVAGILKKVKMSDKEEFVQCDETLKHLEEISKTLHDFKLKSEEFKKMFVSVNAAERKERFYFEADEELKSMINGFDIWVKNPDDPDKKEEIKQFLITWEDRLEDLCESFETETGLAITLENFKIETLVQIDSLIKNYGSDSRRAGPLSDSVSNTLRGLIKCQNQIETNHKRAESEYEKLKSKFEKALNGIDYLSTQITPELLQPESGDGSASSAESSDSE